MAQRFYRIQKAFLIPLGLDVVLLFCLLTMALFLNGEPVEKFVFALFFLFALVIFLACVRRQIGVAERGLMSRNLFGAKEVAWDEITHVGCLSIHRKVYLLLTTVKGLLIVSSAFDRFHELVEEISTRVESERVEAEVRLHAERPATMAATVAPAWVAAVVMTGIMVMKLLPFIR
jgi:hypothetical protein